MVTENKTKTGDAIGAMFAAGAHFGYQKSRRNASTAPFIFGLKNMGTDEWKEKQEVAHSGQVTLAALVESSIKDVSPSVGPTIEGTTEKEV